MARTDRRATLPMDLLIDELTPEKALELIRQRDKSREPIGQHPETGQNIYALVGPYGPYLQLGEQEGDKKPKRISLGRGTDPGGIDLDYALRLLSLPRVIGVDPETDKKVRAGPGSFRALRRAGSRLRERQVGGPALQRDPGRGARADSQQEQETGPA